MATTQTIPEIAEVEVLSELPSTDLGLPAISTTSEQLSTKSTAQKDLNLSPSGAFRAGAGAYGENGIFIGRDGDEYKMSIIGNSNSLTWSGGILSITGTITATAGSIGGWTISANALTSGNVSINSNTERILMGSATAPLTGNGVFLGKDGSVYAFRCGDPLGEYFYYDGTSSAVGVARLTHEVEFQYGWDITAGEILSIESDGYVYPCRVSDISSTIDNQNRTYAYTNGDAGFARITANIALFVFEQSGGGLLYARILCDDDGQITSISEAFVRSGAYNQTDVIGMTTTTAMVAYRQDATSNIYARMMTSLDGTVSIATEYAIDTNAYNPHLVKVSATQALLVYREASTSDIKVRKLDLSGTVITAGAETNIYTGTAMITDFVRFGDSEYYCVSFTDGGPKLIAFQWDGSSFTMGTEISATAGGRPRLGNLDNTRVAWGGADTGVKVAVVSRSGTTLTFNSTITIDTSSSGLGTYIDALGADTFVCHYVLSSNNHYLQLIRATGNVCTELGSRTPMPSTTTSTHSLSVPTIKLSPTATITISQGSSNETITHALTNNYDTRVGIARETDVTGNNGVVIMRAYSAVSSGLTTAQRYYVDIDGAVAQEEYAGNSPSIGVAIATTKLDIQI